MKAVTHLEKVIAGEVSAVTHLEKVIAEETSAATYTEKVIAGEATPITHLEKVIAGVADPVTHLEYVWAGRTPEPTEHEYTGAVPIEILADGTPLLDFLISGNTSQTGTPSPDSPIMPQGTGDRTGNLFDEVYSDISGTIRYRPIFVGDGTFTLSTTTPYDSSVANVFLLSGNVSSGASTSGNGAWKNHNVTAQSVDGYVTIAYRHYSGTTSPVDCQTMLNTGSTALPYEPYGIKIPISSADTTTPVYLGDVQTTRKIKKYEFTGQESIVADLTYSRFSFILNNSLIVGVRKTPAFCTHWQVIDDGRSIADVPNNALYSDSGNSRWFIKTTDYTTADDFKAYLAAQYANGTPVTVWYVLATPTTGIVNEPLMKIGTYADTVSMEQAGVSIPTLNGQTVVDVDTTLKPSEIYIKYKG